MAISQRTLWPRLLVLGVLSIAAAFRLPALADIPNGFIPDEALSAYNANSILQTGRDSSGELLPLFPRHTARLHCLYLYASLPAIALFGLNEWAARLPAALAGILTVWLLYRWMRVEWGRPAGLCGALFLAISPWHVLMSRTGYEWIFLPACVTLALISTQRALAGKGSAYLMGAAWGLGFYSYAPGRIWLPMLMTIIVLSLRGNPGQNRLHLARASGVLMLILVPVIAVSLRAEGLQRLMAVRDDTAAHGAWLLNLLERYLGFFHPAFLFGPSDGEALHRLRSLGLLTAVEGLALLIGLARAWRLPSRWGRVLCCWFFLAPLSVCIHRDSPDPVLSITSLPAIQALSGIGLVGIANGIRRLKRRVAQPLLIALALGIVYPAYRLARDLYHDFPVYSAYQWSYGVRAMVREIETIRPEYDDVLVDGSSKHIGSLILFYARYDPLLRQVETKGMSDRDARARVGAYIIGAIDSGIRPPGRHLVWTTRAVGRDLLPGKSPLAMVMMPDGRRGWALFRAIRNQRVGSLSESELRPSESRAEQ